MPQLLPARGPGEWWRDRAGPAWTIVLSTSGTKRRTGRFHGCRIILDRNAWGGEVGMPTKPPTRRSTVPSISYREWRRRARERLTIPPMGETYWRLLYDRGHSPDEARKIAEAYYRTLQIWSQK